VVEERRHGRGRAAVAAGDCRSDADHVRGTRVGPRLHSGQCRAADDGDIRRKRSHGLPAGHLSWPGRTAVPVPRRAGRALGPAAVAAARSAPGHDAVGHCRIAQRQDAASARGRGGGGRDGRAGACAERPCRLGDHRARGRSKRWWRTPQVRCS
jgi:hypothetical protein